MRPFIWSNKKNLLQRAKKYKVCKLQKFIYGLKQASRSWNIKFDQSVKSFGFIQCPDEHCVYKRSTKIIQTQFYLDKY